MCMFTCSDIDIETEKLEAEDQEVFPRDRLLGHKDFNIGNIKLLLRLNGNRPRY